MNNEKSLVEQLIQNRNNDENIDDSIKYIKDDMATYISTPWCSCPTPKEIKNKDLYKPCYACLGCDYEKPLTSCKETEKSIIYNSGPDGVEQSHGGDLLQHSQWTALHLLWWYNDKDSYKLLNSLIQEICASDIIKTNISDDTMVIKEYLLLCGFMHDIGKGGDGIRDLYHASKYLGKGDGIHPKVCKQSILKPKNRYNGELKKALYDLLKVYKLPKMARKIMAFCAEVHWDLGRTNIPKNHNNHLSVENYIRKINGSLKKVNIKKLFDFIIMLKLAMVISCADIASSYNEELRDNSDHLDGLIPEEHTHNSTGGPWTNYGFKNKHEDIINKILGETSLIHSIYEKNKSFTKERVNIGCDPMIISTSNIHIKCDIASKSSTTNEQIKKKRQTRKTSVNSSSTIKPSSSSTNNVNSSSTIKKSSPLKRSRNSIKRTKKRSSSNI